MANKLVFTIHYGEIKTRPLGSVEILELEFTIHYGEIKTVQRFWKKAKSGIYNPLWWD